MSDTAVIPEINPLKGTVAFTRKISDGNYGGSEFFMSVQYDIDPTADGEQIIASARAAALQAKAVVFEQLGITHTLDESGVVTEQVVRAFPGTVVTNDQGPAAGGDTPPHAGDTKDANEKRANKAWAEARYATNPGDFYDNRPDKASGKYKATSPDVKHRSSGIGLWFS